MVIINKNTKHTKWEKDWKDSLKYLSLILDKNKSDGSNLKSKQLESLITERETLNTEKEKKDKEVRKLESKKKTLKNVFVYNREAQNQYNRIHNNIGGGDNLDTKWGRFNTDWKAHGWTGKVQRFFVSTAPAVLDNVYKVKINGADVEITEDQIINTIARVVKALENVNVADFTAKYNAKETDVTKRGNVAAWLAEIKTFAAEVKGKGEHYDLPFDSIWQKYTPAAAAGTLGTWADSTIGDFNFDNFFDFVELVADKPFLADLDATQHTNVPQAENWNIALKGDLWTLESTNDNIGLKDLGYDITDYGSRVKLYKTGSNKQVANVTGGIAGWLKLANSVRTNDNKAKLTGNFTAANNPNQLLLNDLQAIVPTANNSINQNFIFDTNFALPESEEEMQLIIDELEMAKLDSVMANRNLTDKITEIKDENQTIVTDLAAKDAEIQTIITEIITKKREELVAYKIDKGFEKVEGGEDNRREYHDLYQIQTILQEIRYLENGGDVSLPSSEVKENTALTAVESIIDRVIGFGSNNICHKVYYFMDLLSVNKDGGSDIQQGVERAKAGKYTDSDGKEQSVFYSLEVILANFEEKEKLVKLSKLETEAKIAIKKAIGKEENMNEKLTLWQTELKKIDPILNETIITEEFKTKWGNIGKHQKIADLVKQLASVKKTGAKSGEEYADFWNDVKTWTETKDVDSWAKLLAKEPKLIITTIEKYKYEKLSEENKIQIDRKIRKAFGKTATETIEQDFINEALYEVAIGTKELSKKDLNEKLEEISTPQDGKDKTGSEPKWYQWGSTMGKTLWIGGGLLMIVGMASIFFWDSIKNWWKSDDADKEKELNEEE